MAQGGYILSPADGDGSFQEAILPEHRKIAVFGNRTRRRRGANILKGFVRGIVSENVGGSSNFRILPARSIGQVVGLKPSWLAWTVGRRSTLPGLLLRGALAKLDCFLVCESVVARDLAIRTTTTSEVFASENSIKSWSFLRIVSATLFLKFRLLFRFALSTSFLQDRLFAQHSDGDNDIGGSGNFKNPGAVLIIPFLLSILEITSDSSRMTVRTSNELLSLFLTWAGRS